MNYRYLLTHKELFQYTIGISYRQFESLLPKFAASLRHAEHQRAWRKERVRDPGGGRKPTLKTDRQKLFFILFYYKTYPTFRFAQTLFWFDKRNIQLWVRFLEGVLWSALGYQLRLPSVRVKHRDHWFEICPSLKEFLVDATERAVQRPGDPVTQEFYYSGKKKHHAVKNQLLVHPKTKKILAVSDTVEGKRHDKTLLEDDPLYLKIPPGSTAMGDSAYQGVTEEHPFLRLVVPKKKPPGAILTEGETAVNHRISSIRVRVEHPIAWLKHFNIMSQRFRNRLEHVDLPFKTIACLYNFTRTYR
jgi:hypothetical protein